MPNLLALASAANESVIAYRDTDPNRLEAVLNSARRLASMVDALTGAIVEGANQ